MSVKRHRVAGGVVVDRRLRILVLRRDIERNGRLINEVRLPKGHLDKGESDEQAACREVCEESGYCAVEIVDDLGEAVSEYVHNGVAYRRDERYFLMRLLDARRSDPRPTWHEEALFDPLWLELAEAEARMTYPSEREFVGRARALVEKDPHRVAPPSNSA
ncbi:MAG: NUDIX domain-containing protein [Candidatus Hydrogenedentes bacterium]|nr:NUDIX domain-containing protein [Candidatus Hydrogenedentota bacterium]